MSARRGGAYFECSGSTGGGSGGGLNVNWDGAWDVKTKMLPNGWSAEFLIPLRTLRYGAPPQTWGVNFARAIEHKREQVYWSPLARVYNITRLSSAGELQGLNVAPPRNFKVMPYALAQANRTSRRARRPTATPTGVSTRRSASRRA